MTSRLAAKRSRSGKNARHGERGRERALLRVRALARFLVNLVGWPAAGGGPQGIALLRQQREPAPMRTLLFLAALTFTPLAQAHSIEDLNWMKGCWRTEVLGREITEVWTAPPAPVMLGTAVTRRDAGNVFWEQLRIEERDGALALIAMPGGAAPVRFEMTEIGEDHVVFENPAHDYPKRIVYSRMGRMLTARVSGLSHVLGEAYAYRRISCPRAFLP